jgi:hypothetical protein
MQPGQNVSPQESHFSVCDSQTCAPQSVHCAVARWLDSPRSSPERTSSTHKWSCGILTNQSAGTPESLGVTFSFTFE